MAYPGFSSRFKGKGPAREQHRINGRIRVPEVRVVDENGGQLGVLPTEEALKLAKEKGLDLMEVSPNSRPPVCKIVDYGKFKYEKKKKEQQAKKKQTVVKVKEIQLRPNTEEHDLDYKFKNVRGFLEDGDKAKVTMLFRGRQITHPDSGKALMNKLAEAVQDIGMMESRPKLEGRRMIMILAPLGSASPKKVQTQPSGLPVPKGGIPKPKSTGPATPRPADSMENDGESESEESISAEEDETASS